MLKQTLLLATLLGAPVVLAAQDGPFTKAFASDTLNVGDAAISPDGKWLLLTRYLSEQERQLLIRPMAGGPMRVLPVGRGSVGRPMFTPAGDRLVAVSNLPRRSDADNGLYLVTAGFDTKNGTLTTPFRQISLDHVRMAGLRTVAVSPDGRWVAYVTEGEAMSIRIVPVAGGTPRTLVPKVLRPGGLAWSRDGQSVTYWTVEADPADGNRTRMRVGVDGAKPVRIFSSPGRNLAVESGDPYSFVLDRFSRSRTRGTIRILGASGQVIGEVPSILGLIWRLQTIRGKEYLVGARSESQGPTMLVPMAGGAIRQMTDGTCYDWPAGWSEDGSQFYVQRGRPSTNCSEWVVEALDVEGKVQASIPLHGFQSFVSEQGGSAILQNGPTADSTSRAFLRLNLKTGAQKLLTGPSTQGGPYSPGGMYYGMVGREIYYRQLAGEQMQIRALAADGTSRLITQLPVRGGSLHASAVCDDRLAYLQGNADSVPLRVRKGNGPDVSLGWFKVPSVGFSLLAWSQDGRQLALATTDPTQRLVVYRLDAAGAVVGTPTTIVPPFEYFYEVFWLPDGSGFTMIAQRKGAPKTDVAVVRIADPDHPTLLTRDDPHSVWGHALSPDGKYVIYPSERLTGSAVWMVAVDDLLKAAKKP